MKRKFAVVSVSALAVAIVASGCSNNKGTGPKDSGDATKQESSIATDPKDSLGPAADAPGAVKGGILTILQVGDFEHLDPARSYVTNQQMAMTLVYKTLTTFKEVAQPDGKVKSTLVGDLAETPGTDVNKDCKTWNFKLKKGVKYEDGTEVKAADVAYGIARSFSKDLNEGPHYIQQWLAGDNAYNKVYKGPYDGGADTHPNLEVKGDYELVFKFDKPHCDMPYAASMPMTAPVPKAKDTKGDYDKRPFSSGPYKVKEYKKDASLTLERNTNWDPALDASRTANPDGFVFSFTAEADAISKRLIADSGPDQQAMTWTNVVSEDVPKTLAADVQKRLVQGPTQFVWRLDINTQRITDLNVRKALNQAVDREAMLKPIGGSTAGVPTFTLMSPTTAGWKNYDVFGVAATGDVEKAKATLGGKTVELVLAHANTTRRTNQAIALKGTLEKAGFKITLAPLDSASYYDQIGQKANKFDIYLSGWGSDWPSGSTILPPLYDGTVIAPEGNYNTSYADFPAINAEFRRIDLLSAVDAPAAWAALDEKIMKEFAPSVPLYNDKNYTLCGSKVGGFFLSSAFGLTSLVKIYVKS